MAAGQLARVGLAWALALSLGLAGACLIEIDERLSCGDAYVSEAEQCDPRDPGHGFVDACRARGFQIDAGCDPDSCEILDADQDCNVCGDGIALLDEECDGFDLKSKDCGAGTLKCGADCRLDYGDCPPVCGDSLVSGDEECDPALDCRTSDECPDLQVCYAEIGECVAPNGDVGFLPVIACTDYSSSYAGIDKPYADGTIGPCNEDCLYDRQECSFCGDGELDPAYEDLDSPSGKADIPAEVCDGLTADPAQLAAHCRPLCLDWPYDQDTDVACDFECEPDCRDIQPPDDITPGEIDPDALNCCLGPGMLCPDDPVLPCCAGAACVPSANTPGIMVCPGF